MPIAIIATGGKQYVVTPGQKLKVETLAGEVGDTVKLDTLLIGDDAAVQIGQPLVATKVSATLAGSGRARKIVVAKYKAKTRYKKRVGHRQQFTILDIQSF